MNHSFNCVHCSRTYSISLKKTLRPWLVLNYRSLFLQIRSEQNHKKLKVVFTQIGCGCWSKWLSKWRKQIFTIHICKGQADLNHKCFPSLYKQIKLNPTKRPTLNSTFVKTLTYNWILRLQELGLEENLVWHINDDN